MVPDPTPLGIGIIHDPVETHPSTLYNTEFGRSGPNATSVCGDLKFLGDVSAHTLGMGVQFFMTAIPQPNIYHLGQITKHLKIYLKVFISCHKVAITLGLKVP